MTRRCPDCGAELHAAEALIAEQAAEIARLRAELADLRRVDDCVLHDLNRLEEMAHEAMRERDEAWATIETLTELVVRVGHGLVTEGERRYSLTERGLPTGETS